MGLVHVISGPRLRLSILAMEQSDLLLQMSSIAAYDRIWIRSSWAAFSSPVFSISTARSSSASSHSARWIGLSKSLLHVGIAEPAQMR